MNIEEALSELRKEKKRKFNQAVDLIVNLRGINIKKDNISAVINVPHSIGEKKVCGFLTKQSKLVKTILEPDFQKYKDKKLLKKLVKSFDFFIAVAPLMPKVASVFGKILGPAGKMPSPQLGIITQESEESINKMLENISSSVKIRAKEPSIKVSIGKENMSDEDIIGNIKTAYKGIVNALPNKLDNVKKIMVKFSMSKPKIVEGIQ